LRDHGLHVVVVDVLLGIRERLEDSASLAKTVGV
jgi:hypothetical protein